MYKLLFISVSAGEKHNSTASAIFQTVFSLNLPNGIFGVTTKVLLTCNLLGCIPYRSRTRICNTRCSWMGFVVDAGDRSRKRPGSPSHIPSAKEPKQPWAVLDRLLMVRTPTVHPFSARLGQHFVVCINWFCDPLNLHKYFIHGFC